MSSSERRSWLGRRAFGCVCFLSIWHQRRCFPPKRSASRVLADKVQLALIHMNLLNEIPNANQALVSSLEGESVVIGGDINTALRSVARKDSSSP